MSPALAALAGLAAGSTHVVAGPDHLAAVVPLAVGQGRRALTVGLLWGVGHALGVVALAIAGQLLRASIDLDAWSAAADVGVGVLLVGLGAWTLWRTRTLVVHDHRHGHPRAPHGHVHVHLAEDPAGHPAHALAPHAHVHGRSALGFGVLHGAAGTGHLLGVLPTLAMPPAAAAAYVTGYLAAAIAVMSLVGAVAGRTLTRPAQVQWALRASGVAAIAVGLIWLAW